MLFELLGFLSVIAGIEAWRKTQKEKNENERLVLLPPESPAVREIREQISFWKERYENTSYSEEKRQVTVMISNLTATLVKLCGDEEAAAKALMRDEK